MSTQRFHRPGRGLLLALAVTAAGCTVGPRYEPPLVPTPVNLAAPELPPGSMPLSQVTPEEVDLTAWWAQFHDPVLDHLIARAQVDNPDRRTAASRVREARAAALQARAALFPSLTGTAGYDHIRLGQNVKPSGIGGATAASGAGASAGTTAAASSGGLGAGPIETDVYMLGLQGSYTVDLFGANRAAARVAREREEAQEWSARDTEVTVTSEVARTYFELRAGQAQLAVLRANARTQADLLRILAARSRGGLTNEVDVTQQRSQLALTQAQIPPAEAQVTASRHQLELLLGVEPRALGDELAPPPAMATNPLAGLPAIPPRVPVGLPSTILQRRPDIRAAERQMAASVANVDQATALLYPQIQLTGVFSLASSSLSTLLEWSSRTILGLSSLSQPIFDGGRRRAVKTAAEEQAVQARIDYEKTVLTAFSQTADALARYGADQQQIAVLRAGFVDASRATALNQAQYLGGLADLTATLQAQSTTLQTENQLAQAQGQLFGDLVALYRALGGGWNPDAPVDARAPNDRVPAVPAAGGKP